jgi:GntR family transcriptional repressor for pyruvate dehydrogenase complex
LPVPSTEPTEPTGPNRLYQTVARALMAAIADGRYPVGRRLPAERELALEFDVSRPTVREAVIALEVRGLVEVRVGSGVYVRRPPEARETPGAGIGAFELTEARLLFEGEAAALAAVHVTDADLERLGRPGQQIERRNREGTGGEDPDRSST